MPFSTINGARLFHESTGAGEPILFQHGYTSSHDNWSELIVPRLEDRYRCIVMDARGAGDSEHTNAGYAIAQYASDVIGVADAEGVDRFTYVGHSMGGGIGMQLALDYPERLDRLVLVASIPSGGTTAEPAVHEEQRELRATPAGQAELLRRRLLLQVRDVPEERVEHGLERALSISEGHFEQSWQSMRDFDVSARLGEINTPTLVISGAADGLLEANLHDFLLLPNATLHVFSRVGHGVPGDLPEDFASVIADFMEHGVVNAETQAAKLEAVPAPAP
jgi:pimeloyl-ACP methyl ester carboxylesterase